MMVKCPVCGMDVDDKKAKKFVQYEGQTYYFCASGCKSLFEHDPMHFVCKR